MTMPDEGSAQPLSALEQEVMDVVWEHGPVTASGVRRLLHDQGLTDSTVRTVLRRIEEKGYLTHSEEKRAYVYRALVPRSRAAGRLIRDILERYCRGSVEELLVGMVDTGVLDTDELDELAQRLQREEDEGEEEPGER